MRRRAVFLTSLSAVAALGASCSSDDGSESSPGDERPAATSDLGGGAGETDFTEITATPAGDTDPGGEVAPEGDPDGAPFVDGPLADVCPGRITVQLEDLPSVEHGPLYSLLGPSPEIAADGSAVSAPFVRPDGTVENVVLEVRSGGPALGFGRAIDALADDASITLAVASTADVVIGRETLETLSVVTLTDRSRHAITWDPATYPDADDIASLAATGVEIHHAPAEPFVDFLVATGPLADATLSPTYLGQPAAFVAADGAIAQQGDALVDPFLFAALPQWSRGVRLGLAADAGWDSYDDTLVVRADQHDELGACLARLVRIVQTSIGVHADDPSTTNSVIADVREALNPLTRTSVDLLDRGLAGGVDAGIVVPDGSPTGAFDEQRLADFLPRLVEALGLDPVAVGDIVTNDHLDPDA